MAPPVRRRRPALCNPPYPTEGGSLYGGRRASRTGPQDTMLLEGGRSRPDVSCAPERPGPEGSVSRLRALRLGLAAPHPLFWPATIALLALDAAWLAILGIRIEGPGWPIALASVGALLTAAAILGPVQSEPKLRAMALSAACLVAFTVAAAVFQYLAATLALPFADPWLAAAERWLGFDWTAYVGFLAAHPSLSWWLALAYHSSGPQIALVVIVLGATARLGRLWAFVRLYAVLLAGAVLVSALLPAVGPYAYYRPSLVPAEHIDTVGALWHLDPLARLRDGTLGVLALGDIRGLVTFPSFHVCLAAITAWALAPVPLLGPLALLLNAVVVVAAIGAGGHYLPDILAGAALAALALRSRIKRGLRLHPRSTIARRLRARVTGRARNGTPLAGGDMAAGTTLREI